MSIYNKNKIKDFFIYGFGQAINLVSPLIVMPFIIFNCGQENFGKIGVGFSMALILNGIIDYGSYINGVKVISINRENINVLESKLSSIYFSKLILIIIVFILIVVSIIFIPFFSREKVLFLYSLVIVFAQFINPTWFFQGLENFKWISVINVTSKIIYVSLVLLFINKKADYIFVNLFLGIGSTVGNLLGLLWLSKHYSIKFNKFNLIGAINILKEEFSFSFSQVFQSLYQFFPIILISWIGGNLMAGQFRVIDQIVTIFKTYLNMFFYFVYANICFELDKSLKNGIKIWKQYNIFNFLILFLIITVFYFGAEFIINYFRIDKTQINSTIAYFKIALIIPILVSISLPLRQLMFAFNQNKIYINVTIFTTIFNFVLMIFLTKSYGLIGSFISIVLIEIIIIFFFMLKLNKYFIKSNK